MLINNIAIKANLNSFINQWIFFLLWKNKIKLVKFNSIKKPGHAG